MKPLVESVRARLALWHTGALAALLMVFMATAYVVLERATLQHVDSVLADAADALRLELLAERREEPSDSIAAAHTLQDFRLRDLSVFLYDSGGRPIATSLAAPVRLSADEERTPELNVERLGELVRAMPAAGPGATYLTLPDEEGGHRAYVLPVRLGASRLQIVVVLSMHAQEETLEQVRTAYLIAIPIALLLAWIGGYVIARRSLEPLSAMSRRAAEISASNAHERLPIANARDELGMLATVINALLERLDRALVQQRRFIADASHELRTPIAVLRAEADVALARSDRPAREYRDALAIISRETERMGTIVEDLFLLARADSGEQPLRISRFYLEELVSDGVTTVRSLAARRGVGLRLQAHGEHEYAGDEALLKRVLLNLLDNAIKYSPPGGMVDVSLERGRAADGGAPPDFEISVTDTGPGISAADQPSIFARFYRGDGASPRTAAADVGGSTASTTSGAGLGLAIAQWIASAHGGDLRIGSTSPRGTTFVLTLPGVARGGRGSSAVRDV
ncbi:MAG TPA: ATP-binding protein [Gemmatimonadaceae bacterium]|nr:ATP-binding protein [Gemmatimonadaceae bacterium]